MDFVLTVDAIYIEAEFCVANVMMDIKILGVLVRVSIVFEFI